MISAGTSELEAANRAYVFPQLPRDLERIRSDFHKAHPLDAFKCDSEEGGFPVHPLS